MSSGKLKGNVTLTFCIFEFIHLTEVGCLDKIVIFHRQEFVVAFFLHLKVSEEDFIWLRQWNNVWYGLSAFYIVAHALSAIYSRILHILSSLWQENHS